MRFDYIKYDDVATQTQENFKDKCEILEAMVQTQLQSPRAKAIAVTKLEEFYMWVGKAVRDDQISRNGNA